MHIWQFTVGVYCKHVIWNWNYHQSLHPAFPIYFTNIHADVKSIKPLVIRKSWVFTCWWKYILLWWWFLYASLKFELMDKINRRQCKLLNYIQLPFRLSCKLDDDVIISKPLGHLWNTGHRQISSTTRRVGNINFGDFFIVCLDKLLTKQSWLPVVSSALTLVWHHCMYQTIWLFCIAVVFNTLWKYTWWRHQMEAFSALLVSCAGNSPISGEFPAQRPVTRSFDVFFDLRLNKRLSKLSPGWWF